MRSSFQKGRGEYGFDAPSGLFVLGGSVFALGILAVVHALSGRRLPAVLEILFGLPLLVTFISYLYSTRKGKFHVWSELLDDLRFRGDEQTLDMGCGRGAVLGMIAKRVDRGGAVGLDLWSSVDQSGNNREATLRNLDLEGVGKRCRVATGNMMTMPFADATFDVVVSNLAIHNIKGQRGRFRALDEAYRVLKLGGRLVIVDLSFTKAYAKHLRERGMDEVERRSLDWRCWFGIPWVAGLVTATKPPARRS
jgi:ubiquinone/menaquinone biosynthesis C-methylase UbiE